MRLPWVSREALNISERRRVDAAERAVKAETYAAGRDAEVARHIDMYHDLLDKYHALKLQGASVIEPPAGPQVIVHPTPDPVRVAIREQVRANPDMRGLDSYLTKYAAELRDNQNLSPKEIIAKLLKWDSSETMSEPVDPILAVEISEDAA